MTPKKPVIQWERRRGNMVICVGNMEFGAAINLKNGKWEASPFGKWSQTCNSQQDAMRYIENVFEFGEVPYGVCSDTANPCSTTVPG